MHDKIPDPLSGPVFGPVAVDLTDPEAYGEVFAEVYDGWYRSDDEGVELGDTELLVKVIASYLQTVTKPRVLELGVGTGRVARSFNAIGIDVVGLDISTQMLDRCARSDRLWLVRGDMRHLPVRGELDAVVIAFNTLFNLTSIEDQRRCLNEVRRCLAIDGVFAVETMADLERLAGSGLGLFTRSDHEVIVSAVDVDAKNKILSGRHVCVDDAGVTLRPWRIKYLSITELDSLATAVGFKLLERVHSAVGSSVLSVYEK